MLFNLKVLVYLDLLLLIGLLGFREALPRSARDMISPKVVALILATPAVALLSGNVYVFQAYLICAVAFTSRSRMELCCIYLLMLPMAPPLQFYISAGGTYLLSLASFSSINIGAVIGMMLTSGRVRRTDPMLDLSVVLLFLIVTFIDLRGVTATAMLRFVLQSAIGVLPPYLLISRGAADHEDMRKQLLHLCLAAFLGSVVAAFGMVRNWDLYEPFYSALNVSQTMGSTALAIRGGLMRMGGPFEDYSAYGLFLAAIIASLPALRSSFSRIGFSAVSAVLLVGIFSTQSRGAWIGLITGFTLFQWLRGRRTMAAAIVVVGAIGYISLGTILAPTSRLGETFGVTGAARETVDYRKRLLTLGLEQIAAHPITGQSPDALIANLPELVQGQHIVDFVNAHLFIAMSTGLIGFAVWMVILVSAAVRVTSHSRRDPADLRRTGLSMVPAVILVSAGVSLVFTSLSDRNLYWLVLALGFAVPVVTRRGRLTRGVQASPDRKEEPRTLVATIR